MGLATEGMVSEIRGSPGDLTALAERVPLVVRVGAHAYRAHDLWLEALDGLPDGATLAATRARALDVLVGHGELARVGALAVRNRDWAALDRIAGQLVGSTLMTLPYDIARGWLDQVPAEHARTGGFLLLAAAVRYHRNFADPMIDALVDAAEEGFAKDGPIDQADPGRAVALTLGVMAAQMRFDQDRLAVLSRTVQSPDHLRHTEDGVGVHSVRRCARATGHELAGRVEDALTEIATVERAGLPAAVQRLVARLELRCLMLAGRPLEAAACAERRLSEHGLIPNGDDPTRLGYREAHHLTHTPAFARWLGGDPSGFLSLEQVDAYEEQLVNASARDRLIGAILHAGVAASWGHVSRSAADSLEGVALRPDQPREPRC